jgi:hypothetical protein
MVRYNQRESSVVQQAKSVAETPIDRFCRPGDYFGHFGLWRLETNIRGCIFVPSDSNK